ncbi:uncharacterized protein F5891DRAFT_1193981 [Suillus fuscotomentosus]|uniref:Uncharacterized protein n=1 Tax=Suillus fuscotomentosus TaxID=1912939 RepID=A0AAD4HHG4_9AGAM|nr:uncharacterized protein F5891DRAFT_1193981 [Suillus fuscotomentosus]KAG1895649.1 hypothetical protein F5891DRAFT_1193981 [Suillus fuscotomentosus]
MKGLYIATRYLPFIMLATDLYRSFTLNENTSYRFILAQVFAQYYPFSPDVSPVSPYYMRGSDSIHPGFFILRTYVLWNKNRILFAAMLSTFFTFLGASFGIVFATAVPVAYPTSAIPGITGCYETSFWYFMPFLLFSVFQLGLMILTLIRAIQSWQRSPSPLYVVLVKHNIFYYACGLLFSVTNIFMSLLLQASYRTMLYDFEFTILAILTTRMHLHLWRINQHAHGSGASVGIPMSDMSTVISIA